MAVIHIPQPQGRFGGIVIPANRFNGVSDGLGVLIDAHHPAPDTVALDVRRFAKAQGAHYAGSVELPAGRLLGFTMPSAPDKIFIQMGLEPSAVRNVSNAVNLDDQGDILSRWQAFHRLNEARLPQAHPDTRAAMSRLDPRYLPDNAHGVPVVERLFGRGFLLNGEMHNEWEIARDGQRKDANGRASLFHRAHTLQDWHFIARAMLGRLHARPDDRISTRDLEDAIALARIDGGAAMDMEGLREIIEAETAFVRGQNVASGRISAHAFSVGFPPHDPRDRSGRRVVLAQFSTPPAVGEVAAEFLKPKGRTVLEPTIGNGVFAAATHGAGGLVTGIEIDANRLGRVQTALPGSRAIQGDAMQEAAYPASLIGTTDGYDAVLANPPYADLPEDQIGPVYMRALGTTFKPKKAETRIAALALDKLNEGGNAVLVMPAEMMNPDQLNGHRKQFQSLLTAMFEKVDSVVLDAHLYRNMGSNFPVIVHFCENRLPYGDTRDLADAARMVPDSLEVVASFERFYERANAILADSAIEALPEDVAESRIKEFRDSLAAQAAARVGAPQDETVEATADDQSAAEQPRGATPAEEPATVENEAPAHPPRGDGTAADASITGGAGGGSGGGRGQGASSRPKPVPANDRGRPPQAGAGEPDGAEGDRLPSGEAAASPPQAAAEPETEFPAPADMPVGEWFKDDYSPDPFTTPYVPFSRKGTTKAVIERTMEHETYAALRRVEEAVQQRGLSGVDEYVASKMGVSLAEFMSDAVLFYPEQVDSLALTFFRREEGRASIIGDQMGVGKGIQLAAHGYSALAVEGRPILFMSNKPNLFTDFCVRDMRNASGRRFMDMVDDGLIRPFFFNKGTEAGLKENEKVVFRTSPDQHKEAERTESLGDANMVGMTYSQVQIASGAWRARAIMNWITDNAERGRPPVLLLDEIHKAAGIDSRTGEIMRAIISHAERHDCEIVYSSATSVKSGKNLPIYRPALPDTGLAHEELMLAIEQMPLAMQEVLASEMAQGGSLIERKMPDAGVDRDLVVLADISAEKMDYARKASDFIASKLQEMQEMSAEIAQAAKKQFKDYVGGMAAAGSLDKIRVETTSPMSQLDSFSRYLMGSVKGMFVRELIEDSIARGEKPTVVVEYTGDSVSEWLIGNQHHLMTGGQGVPVAGHPNMGDVLKRFAEKLLIMKGTDALGNQSTLKVEGFDGWLADFFESIEQFDLSELRINVFDRVREACEELGMTFEDITGRTYEFIEGEDGVVRAYNRDIPPVIDAVERYNRGQTDVLGLNSGSATGVSAQASPHNGPDLRRRSMIKLAYQREITDERQVEGRIHRAGQVSPPRYITPVTGFAADDRIANLFNRANRSLTSSTSATRDSKTNAKHAVDILNPVGEMAVGAVMQHNPQIAAMLGFSDKEQDMARKLLGRSVLLPLDTQSAVLSDVDATFHLISDQLTAEGRNPLELGRYDWKAKVEEVEVLDGGGVGVDGLSANRLVLNQVTYDEPIRSLPVSRALEHVDDYLVRRLSDPFQNMADFFGYTEALRAAGGMNLEHHLFGGVTGRSKEGMRYLFPRPLPQEVSAHLYGRMRSEVLDKERKVQRTINDEELREISEQVAEQALKSSVGPFAEFLRSPQTLDKDGSSLFEDFKLAMPLRALYRRIEQATRLEPILREIEPGRMVALDSRAVSPWVGGMWADAYRKANTDGFIPALIVSARYDEDAPFAESKMNFSVYVPGNQHIEGLTVSMLSTAMEHNDASRERGLVNIRNFLSDLELAADPHRYTSDQRKKSAADAIRDLMGEEGARKAFLAAAELASQPELGPVVSADRTVNKVAVEALSGIAAALPTKSVKKTRLTMEGNLFAAMSIVSNGHGNNMGEKVVYTDAAGNNRNAILLNDRGAKDMIPIVKAKASQRSVLATGINSPDDITAYLRVTNAVLYGLPRYGGTQEAAHAFAEALHRLYPKAYPQDRIAEIAAYPEAEIHRIRAHVQPVDSIKSYPPSLMAGGDIWRWAADESQRATVSKSKGGRIALKPGDGGSTRMEVVIADDPNAMGVREVSITQRHDTERIAKALCESMDKKQMGVMMFAEGVVVVGIKKDHPVLRNGDHPIISHLSQNFTNKKLTKGTLSGTFYLNDPREIQMVADLMQETARENHGEIMIGGTLKQVQNALAMHVRETLDARLAAERERMAQIERDREASLAAPTTFQSDATVVQRPQMGLSHAPG